MNTFVQWSQHPAKHGPKLTPHLCPHGNSEKGKPNTGPVFLPWYRQTLHSLATEGTGWNSPTNTLTRKLLFVMQHYDVKSPFTNCITQLNISDKLLSKLPSKFINNLSSCLEAETAIWSFRQGTNLNILAISTNFKDVSIFYRLQKKF